MSRKVEEVRDFLVDLVLPYKRNDFNIIPDHLTVLRGTKSTKQFSKKKPNKRAVGLTRREYAELGLNCLPTHQMKYEEALPLHHLWKGYIREHLELMPDEPVPQIHEPGYEAFSKLLVRTDLHGAKLRVIESKCDTFLGLSGIMVLETKNVLKLLGKDHRIRSIPKTECVFAMKVGNAEFIIYGNQLAIRPAERTVKKIKNNIKSPLAPS